MRKLAVWLGVVTIAAGGEVLVRAVSIDSQSQTDKPKTGVVATVTATGCVERWRPIAPAMAQPNSHAPSGVEYVLTHVEGVTQSATAAGGGVPESTSPTTRYLLLPDPARAFASHLNHRVKIVGTIAPQPADGATATDQLTDPSSSETNLPAGPRPAAYQDNVVEVSTLTVISKGCGK
jgi:hypothetical protein